MDAPARPDKPARDRDALRRALVDAIPAWYSPVAHLVAPSLFGLAVIAACVLAVDDLRPWQLLAIPLTILVANAAEWRIHRDMLHRRSRLAPVLYERHTPQHHMVYATGDMAMRSRREFRLVLIPAYGVVLAFASMLLPAGALWLAGFPNLGALFMATDMAYVLAYEWLHLSYHLPDDHVIGRSRAIRRLKRHHAVHHDPRLMQRYNFNVTLPLWDWIRGTIAREPLADRPPDPGRSPGG